MDEAITIQVLNFLDFSFSQFLGILSYDAIEKEQLPILESLAQSLKDEKLQMKNQDKARANYAKQFTKKKAKLPLSQLEDFQDLKPDLVTKCKFSKKKHKQNKYQHLQAKCHYCHKTNHITKFCKKKVFSQASSKQVITYIQSLSYIFRLLKLKAFALCLVNAEFSESSVQKIIINFSVIDHFFSNCTYFLTYTKYHYKFQNSFGEILAVYGYGNIDLHLAHPDGSKIIWTIKKVSWAL